MQTGPDDNNPIQARWPRPHHWLMAAAALFVMGIVVPLFAAFI
ncbi:hypothetical protein [Sphingobium sp. HWE2-09]|nr:hypothetical protein [Sphingobium sp. HWE2-09]